MEPTEHPAPEGAEMPALDELDLEGMWQRLEAGQKARAVREVYETQQKKVIEMQRLHAAKIDELAVAVVRARGTLERGLAEEAERMRMGEVEPLRTEIQRMGQEIAEANALLTAYQTIGRGII